MTVDPITFGVIAGRLSGIVQEMQDNIFRTGYSTIVRESQDASCMLLDANGDVVGEHVVLPLHVTALPGVVRAIRRDFGDDLHPGDAFITNHPYLADVTHSVDMALAMPVFAEDRLVAFCASIAHKSDLGGMVPGTGSGNAREIFHEGMLFPPVRYVNRGTIAPDIDALLRANSRTPDLVIGDIRGQVGVARLGERRLHETIARYGLAAVLGVFADKQTKTAARMRAAIASWPDGESEAEAFVDHDGVTLDRPVRYHVRVTKRADRLTFDFSGSSDQTLGPINVGKEIVRGCCYYALIAIVDPTIENNGGLARVTDVIVRPGSVLDPRFPAPTNNYTSTASALTEAIVAALSELATQRRVAGVGGVGGALAIGGTRADGRPFSTYESVGSAYGARSGKDGVSGVSVLLSNARIAPVEIMESEYPLRVRRFELIPDSGGAGAFRGGLGPVREYEVLVPETQVTLRGGKHAIPAAGIASGGPGRLGACTVLRGDAARNLGSRFSGELLRAGEVLRLEKAGGGGLGAAHERPFERVLDDVLDGYVTRDAAVSAYGADAVRLDAELAAWSTR